MIFYFVCAIIYLMYNWSTDEKKLKDEDPEGYKIWRLEQLINYGLGGERIKEKELKEHLNELDIDQPTRKYLEFLLWPDK